MILCDTNILIEFYKGNARVIETLRNIGPTNLAISVITLGELYYGAKNRQELRRIRVHLSQVAQFPVDTHISDIAIGLLERYVLSHRLSVPDALIAATAMRHDIALYTLNVKDFQYISGLRLYLS